MRQFLRARPWIFIVVLLGAMVLANLVLVWVSLHHPAIPSS